MKSIAARACAFYVGYARAAMTEPCRRCAHSWEAHYGSPPIPPRPKKEKGKVAPLPPPRRRKGARP